MEHTIKIVIASTVVLVASLVLTAPALAQHKTQSAAAAVATNGDAAQHAWDQHEQRFFTSNVN